MDRVWGGGRYGVIKCYRYAILQHDVFNGMKCKGILKSIGTKIWEYNIERCRYEQAKITTLVAETGLHFHLGLKYNEATQTFEWASGEEFTYAHWAEYEPGSTLG